ncbi:hypothetical protein BaRGS_00028545 [Batillaria attramentaria]|uniref:RING-type domain-containing protein n=1 Tax=Batillaria attramentaria TaxID=370345 RepID=A0ABD0JZX6_9CAEN
MDAKQEVTGHADESGESNRPADQTDGNTDERGESDRSPEEAGAVGGKGEKIFNCDLSEKELIEDDNISGAVSQFSSTTENRVQKTQGLMTANVPECNSDTNNNHDDSSPSQTEADAAAGSRSPASDPKLRRHDLLLEPKQHGVFGAGLAGRHQAVYYTQGVARRSNLQTAASHVQNDYEHSAQISPKENLGTAVEKNSSAERPGKQGPSTFMDSNQHTLSDHATVSPQIDPNRSSPQPRKPRVPDVSPDVGGGQVPPEISMKFPGLGRPREKKSSHVGASEDEQGVSVQNSYKNLQDPKGTGNTLEQDMGKLLMLTVDDCPWADSIESENFSADDSAENFSTDEKMRPGAIVPTNTDAKFQDPAEEPAKGDKNHAAGYEAKDKQNFYLVSDVEKMPFNTQASNKLEGCQDGQDYILDNIVCKERQYKAIGIKLLSSMNENYKETDLEVLNKDTGCRMQEYFEINTSYIPVQHCPVYMMPRGGGGSDDGNATPNSAPVTPPSSPDNQPSSNSEESEQHGAAGASVSEQSPANADRAVAFETPSPATTGFDANPPANQNTGFNGAAAYPGQSSSVPDETDEDGDLETDDGSRDRSDTQVSVAGQWRPVGLQLPPPLRCPSPQQALAGSHARIVGSRNRRQSARDRRPFGQMGGMFEEHHTNLPPCASCLGIRFRNTTISSAAECTSCRYIIAVGESVQAYEEPAHDVNEYGRDDNQFQGSLAPHHRRRVRPLKCCMCDVRPWQANLFNGCHVIVCGNCFRQLTVCPLCGSSDIIFTAI